MRIPSCKPGTVNHVGISFEDRFKQVIVLARIVLQVSILNDQKIPRSLGNPPVESRPLPHIDGLAEQPDIFTVMTGHVFFNDLNTAVPRKIIDEDYLLFQISSQPDGNNPVKNGFYGFLLVVYRNDHRKLQTHCIRFNPSKLEKKQHPSRKEPGTISGKYVRK